MLSEEWDKVAHQVDFNLKIDRDRFTHLIGFQSKILDFGCGYGRITNELTKCGYADVVGIDPSSAMVERGLAMFPGLSLLHLADSVLPFADSCFDAVVTCAVFTCIPALEDRAKAASEIARVLKPGGLLHVSEFCSEEGRAFTSGLGMPMYYGSAREMRHLLNMFQCCHEEVVAATTMRGRPESSYRAFYAKPFGGTVVPPDD